MSAVFCKQCGMTDDQQAKCDDGSGVFCQECDEFIDVEVLASLPRLFLQQHRQVRDFLGLVSVLAAVGFPQQLGQVLVDLGVGWNL